MIRDNPARAVAMAFGVGVLLGVVVGLALRLPLTGRLKAVTSRCEPPRLARWLAPFFAVY